MIKKIFLVHHTHTDIGYTDIQTRVFEDHIAFIDKVLDYCKRTDGYPDASKFQWTCEVSWQVRHYFKERPEKIKEFIQRVKEGRIEITGLYLNVTELCTAEELIRSLYFAKGLEKESGIRVVSAMNSDVPGISWGIPQILARAGIRYFSMAGNTIRAKKPTIPQPFYWVSPDGSGVLVWNYGSYTQGYELGLGESYKKTSELLSKEIEKLERKGYPYDAFCVRAALDNVSPHLEVSRIVKEWNEKHVLSKMVVSTNKGFFEYMERKYRHQIPSYQLAWPDWWADGNASAAYETGLSRETQRNLKIAEQLFALESLHGDYYPKRKIDEVWNNLMFFDEHTWGAASTYGPGSPIVKGGWAIKSSFIYNAAVEAERLLKRFKALWGINPGSKDLNLEIGLLKAEIDGLLEKVIVFNPLPQKRRTLIFFTLPEELLGKYLVVKDGKKIFPIQIEKVERDVPWRKEEARVSFVASIPSAGYKTFEVVSQKQTHKNIFIFGANSIENSFYKVSLDPVTGGMKSIYDKELKKELVDQESPHVLNQCIYEEVDSPQKRNPLEKREVIYNATSKVYGVTSPIKEESKFLRFSPVSSQIKKGKDGPLMASLIVQTKVKRCYKIIQEVILYQSLKRIDIINTLFKEETLDPEAIYYVFPFNFKSPQIRIETAGAVMRPESEQLPGSAKDYYSVQDWLTISGKDYSVVWVTREAPLVQFGEINTGKWLDRIAIKNGTLFSWVMNNYWYTNFKASQGGKTTFHYSISSCQGKINNSKAFAFAQECNIPATVLPFDKGSKRSLPDRKCSLLSLNKKNVILLALKMAEDGKGIVVRLQEIDGKDTKLKMSLPSRIKKVHLTDIVERNHRVLPLKNNSVRLKMEGFEICTLRLVTAPAFLVRK